MTDPTPTPPLDLDSMRAQAVAAENLNAGAHVTNAELLALIARLETAEAWTTVYPCKDASEPPYDFLWCETHDRTFPLDGSCDHKGKSANDWMDDRENEQRFRAIRAEDALAAAKSDKCPCDFNRPQDCKPELYMQRHRVMPAWARAEAAEAKIAAVREVAADWERDEDSKGLHGDLLAALEGTA